MIIRRLARPMLATIFIAGGINAMRDTEGHAQAVKPWLDKTVGQQAGNLPEGVPTDPPTLVRIDAGVKIGAGTLLALNKFPRLASTALFGSLVPTTLANHPFWEFEDTGQRQMQMTQFLKNVSLAGGLIIAASDTAGKPSVGWRARRAANKAGKQAQLTGDVAQTAGKVGDKTRKAAEQATKQAQLTGEAVQKRGEKATKQSRKAAQKANKQALQMAGLAEAKGAKAGAKATKGSKNTKAKKQKAGKT